jgi:flagellar biosynthetic protein FlhB
VLVAACALHDAAFDVADSQRTQKATPKRVREFRKRGDIALSRDLVSTATMAGGFVALVACSGMAGSALLELTRKAAMASDGGDAVGMPSATLHGFLLAAGPAMIGAAAGALIAMLSQLGWPPAFKAPSFDFAHISPMRNLPNTFGLAGMARRSGAAIAKLALVGAIVAMALRHHVVSDGIEAGPLGAFAWGLVRRTMWLVLGVLGVLAAADYYLARRRMAEQMRMTPDEVKREHREQEGDPMIRGRRKARMRELAKRRIAVAVATADVVVVNPTHYAVALRYVREEGGAPVVVAKGLDLVAIRIREVATSHGIPVIENKSLAQSLYKSVEVDKMIPPEFYKAVAEIVFYVMSRQAQTRPVG